MREHRRELSRGATVAAVAVLAGVIPAGAAAHAIVTPAASRPADLQQYTLTVPTERDRPTVEVDVKIPDGVSFVLVEDAPGWKVVLERKADRVDVVRLSGGSIGPGRYATFHLLARNPVQEGELAWKVKQVYAGGETVLWGGDPGSETPASRTRISESAPADGVIDVVGGRGATAASAVAAPQAGGRDGLALALGAAGLALGALALSAVAAGRWRGRA